MPAARPTVGFMGHPVVQQVLDAPAWVRNGRHDVVADRGEEGFAPVKEPAGGKGTRRVPECVALKVLIRP